MKNRIYDLLDNPASYMEYGGAGKYELVSELSFLRSIVKYKNLKVIVYGAGLYGEYIIRFLHAENIKVEFIIDIDVNKEGMYLDGVLVCNPKRLPDMQEKYLAVIATYAFVFQKESILATLNKKGIFEYIYPFDSPYGLPDYNHEWSSFFIKNKSTIAQIYDLLADEKSKDVYFEYVKAFVCNCNYEGKTERNSEKYLECYKPLKEEVFLNIGSCIGDTIFYFIENRNEIFRKIYAVEGDEVFFSKLQKNIRILPNEIYNKIETKNIFLNGKNIEGFEDATLINMDIEGVEKEVVLGLKDTIQNNRPVLAICAYHRVVDIIKLPQIITDMVDNYDFLFRKYPPCFNNPTDTGELVMYAIPIERRL